MGLSSFLHNVPPDLTQLVGREKDIAYILTRLRSPVSRVITLFGTGGIGKTRLAIACARQITADDFEHGVYYVPLTPVTSPDDIGLTIGTVLGFEGQKTVVQYDELVAFLKTRNLLLILDNFEHLIAGKQIIIDIVRQAPDVKILITSREILNLRSETIIDVTGLFVPAAVTPDFTTYSAIQLFVNRASRIRSDFLVEAHADCILHICKLVGGLPLAIELVTSWIRVLSCEQIIEHIHSGIDFLTSRHTHILERHRSIRAVFNQSWQLLTRDEQHVLMCVSVFNGGFTYDAVMSITGVDMTTLTGLIDKSLIRLGNDQRYQIHELVRQYGAECLQQSGKHKQIRMAHMTYFAQFLSDRLPDIKGRRQVDALREIRADMDNLTAAWQLACQEAQYDLVEMMLDCWIVYFDIMRYPPNANALYDYGLEHLAVTNHEDEHYIINRLRIARNYMLYRQSNQYVIDTIVMQSVHSQLQTARHYQDNVGIILCLIIVSNLMNTPQFPEEMDEAYQISLDIREPYYVGMILDMKAFYYTIINKHSHQIALDTAQKYLDLSQQSGNVDGVSTAYFHMTQYYRFWGDLSLAKHYLQLTIDGYQQIGHRQGQTICLALLTDFEFRLGKFDNIIKNLKIIWEDLTSFGFLATHGYNLMLRAKLNVVYGNYRQSKQNLDQTVSYQINPVTKFMIRQVRIMCAVGEEDYEYVYANIIKNLTTERIFIDDRNMLDFILVIAFLYHHYGNHSYATELLGLTFEHPLAVTGWMKRWDLLMALLRTLEQELGKSQFEKYWAIGAEYDLSETVEHIKHDLKQDTSHTKQDILIDRLTPKQLDVLCAMVNGKTTDKELAEHFVVAHGTVRAHIHQITQKLGVQNRTEAVLRAIQLDLC